MHKVLVVEDDHAIQFMYKLKLENAGFKVKTADNGAVGLANAYDFMPNLILLDLMMPVMNGADMLQKLRETEWGKDIRVIVLTNVSRDEAPSVLRFLRVDRYIVKAHYTPAQVLDIVQQVLA